MKKFLAAVLAGVCILCLWCTVKGEGYTIDALMYSSQKAQLISAMEKEDYEKAADCLSFYSVSSNLDESERRRRWTEFLQGAGFSFKDIQRTKLYTDNGLTKSYATATLDDGRQMTFTIIVQGGGLAISNVCFDGLYDSAICRFLTTYDPG